MFCKTRTRRHRRSAGFVAAAFITSLGIAPAALAQSGDDDDSSVAGILEDLASDLAGRRLPNGMTEATFAPVESAQVELGRLLFHDKILSGNKNISCATCHHPLTDTGDGLSLSVGEGGQGLGVTRNTGVGKDAIPERVPRNAPHLFNIGAKEFVRMFHDGRVEADPTQPGGFRSPAGNDLPLGLRDAKAVQAMFPPTSTTEMAGQPGENNEIAEAAGAGRLAGEDGVWELLAQRLREIPEYVKLFGAAFDDIGSPDDITFVHAANAIAAYESAAFRADNSPFDRFLRGEKGALSRDQRRGMKLFYGAARCGDCHSGPLQTNHGFAATAMPQIGPGKGDNQAGYDDGHDDFGRERVTGDPDDRFKFRVPSLRNVALTGPWGHAGAYNSLEAVVRHQLRPRSSLHGYDTSQAVLPSRPDLDAHDFVVMQDGKRRREIARACELKPRGLSDRQVEQLIAFLHALTDPRSLDYRHEVPSKVPSG
ncbi:MAG: cytochrome-c peroxidase, partial [Planctomycetota bacterium]